MRLYTGGRLPYKISSDYHGKLDERGITKTEMKNNEILIIDEHERDEEHEHEGEQEHRKAPVGIIDDLDNFDPFDGNWRRIECDNFGDCCRNHRYKKYEYCKHYKQLKHYGECKKVKGGKGGKGYNNICSF